MKRIISDDDEGDVQYGALLKRSRVSREHDDLHGFNLDNIPPESMATAYSNPFMDIEAKDEDKSTDATLSNGHTQGNTVPVTSDTSLVDGTNNSYDNHSGSTKDMDLDDDSRPGIETNEDPSLSDQKSDNSRSSQDQLHENISSSDGSDDEEDQDRNENDVEADQLYFNMYNNNYYENYYDSEDYYSAYDSDDELLCSICGERLN